MGPWKLEEVDNFFYLPLDLDLKRGWEIFKGIRIWRSRNGVVCTCVRYTYTVAMHLELANVTVNVAYPENPNSKVLVRYLCS